MRDFIKIVESVEQLTTAYHITLARNVNRVLADGLIPRQGPRTRRLKDDRPAIYLFPTIADAEKAFSNWMGEEFSRHTRLALLKITIPHTIEVFSDEPYERHVYEPIPAVCITVQSRDLDGELGFDHLS